MQKFYLHNGGFIFWFQDEFVYLLMQCLNRRFFGRWLLSRFLCACVCLVLKEAVSLAFIVTQIRGRSHRSASVLNVQKICSLQ